jgi:septation ring formation regulator EzrA
VQQLVNRAVQEFDEYQKLTSEGKLGEAGKKLEEHKRTLEELRKATGKSP